VDQQCNQDGKKKEMEHWIEPAMIGKRLRGFLGHACSSLNLLYGIP
jgi:hypothetical protein